MRKSTFSQHERERQKKEENFLFLKVVRCSELKHDKKVNFVNAY